MKLNKLILPVLVAIVFASCTKSSDPGTGTGTVAAKTEIDVSYGTDPAQRMDIYLPANRTEANTKVLILIHGGGWVSGDKSDFNGPLIDTLKSRVPEYAIFNINYRLGALPATNQFPAQELDVKAAIEYIYANRSTYLVGNKFVLMGASAGGHLALLHAYKHQSLFKIKAVVDFFGPTDMVDMHNNPGTYSAASIALLLGGTPATNPTIYAQSSPMTFATATACPTIILQGGLDPLVNPTTQSLALKNKLVTSGVVNEYAFYPLGGHGGWDVATNTDAFNKIQLFLSVNVP